MKSVYIALLVALADHKKNYSSRKRKHVIGADLSIETSYWDQGLSYVAGVDEAGRGCLAGPVVAAAVMFPPGIRLPGVTDSKKTSALQREAILSEIKTYATSIGIGFCTPAEIDTHNILNASHLAMKKAAEALVPPPEMLLVDGNRFLKKSPWPFQTVVKGDALSHAIAAASIVAKTARDAFMQDLHTLHPEYCWDTNMGYPTREHYRALETHGPTSFHRQSFKLSRK